jgi:hypothetical protein
VTRASLYNALIGSQQREVVFDMTQRAGGGALTRMGIVGELLSFLWQRKLWWLIPMILVIVLFGVLLIFAQGSAVAPFIYTLF